MNRRRFLLISLGAAAAALTLQLKPERDLTVANLEAALMEWRRGMSSRHRTWEASPLRGRPTTPRKEAP